MKIAKVLVPVLFWVGLAIILFGVVGGVIADASYLGSNPFSAESLPLMFGRVASPIWEGLALIAGGVIIGRLYGAS